MNARGWLVWSAGRVTGLFPTPFAAVGHLKVLTNDHRRKVEVEQLTPEVIRYVGPRGKRHGTSRLVAFVCTPRGAQSIGLDLPELLGAAGSAL